MITVGQETQSLLLPIRAGLWIAGGCAAAGSRLASMSEAAR